MCINWLVLQKQIVHVIPNGEQAIALKKYHGSGELNQGIIELLLTKEKPKQTKVILKPERIQKYFPENYTAEEMETFIYELLEQWKQEGGRQ